MTAIVRNCRSAVPGRRASCRAWPPMRGAYGRAMAMHTAEMAVIAGPVPWPEVYRGCGRSWSAPGRSAGEPRSCTGPHRSRPGRPRRAGYRPRPTRRPSRPARAVTAEGDRPVQIIDGHGDEEDLRLQPISHRPRPGRPSPGLRGGSEPARRHRHPARASRALTGPAAKASEPTTPRRSEPCGTYAGRSQVRAIPAALRVQAKRSGGDIAPRTRTGSPDNSSAVSPICAPPCYRCCHRGCCEAGCPP